MDCIKMMALGRQFAIGSLYNYVEDKVVPNVRLWDLDDVSRFSSVKSLKKKTVKIHSEVSEKPDSVGSGDENDFGKPWLCDLGMDYHSAMSFTGGMIRPSNGAWQYVTDRVNGKLASFQSSGNQVSIYCSCSSKKVSVDPTSQQLEIICRPEKLVNSKATHVVVAISYGMEAFCIFPQDLENKPAADDEELIEKVSNYARLFADGLLEERNQLEPDQDQEGDEEDGGQTQQIPKDLNCVVYSDLKIVKREPSWTFLSVNEQYQTCKEILEHQPKKAIPVKIWLYPLNKLLPTVNGIRKVHQDISNHLVIRCQAIMQRWHITCLKAELMVVQLDNKEQQIPSNVMERIRHFNESIHRLLSAYLQMLSTWIVAVRQGDLPNELPQSIESDSSSVLTNINNWMKHQQQQLKTLNQLAKLPGVQLLNEVDQLESATAGFNSLSVVLHLPTNLSTELDSFILDMKNFIQVLNDSNFPSQVQWGGRSISTSVLTDHRQFLAAGQEFSEWVTCYNSENSSVRYFMFYGQRFPGIENQLPFIQLNQCRSSRGSTEILYENFTIPKSPGEIEVEENHRGVISLSWTNENQLDRSNYLVQYRRCDGSGEHWESIRHSANSITISHLQSEERYVFRVAVVTPGGQSPFSPVSEEVTVDPVCPPPSEIQCRCTTDTSLTITWEHQDFQEDSVDDESESTDESESEDVATPVTFENVSYLIECWMDGDQESSFIQRSTVDKTITLEPLVPDLEYCIQIRAVCIDTSGSTFYSPASSVFKSKTLREAERTALIVRRVSQKCPANYGIDTFQLPIKKQHRGNRNPGIGHYVFGEPSYLALAGKRRQRTILMLGATGSGKSTLINAMVNYVLGVEWDDDFRFKLIDESMDKSQAHSQTDLVTTYDLYEMKGSRLGYSLTVVDTPGFGDTRGLEKDKLIMQQIQNYFQCRHGIQQLEAICFVIQSSLPRLTATQQYIFDSILSIFGQDIKDNIRLMVTFSDNALPPVLGAVKEAGIPSPLDPTTGLPLHHKFNNSIFFTSNKGDRQTNEFNRTYFEMAVEGFDRFFEDLSLLEAKSLTLTREVLEERKKLEALVEGLQMRTEMKLTRVDELEQIKKILTENQDQMEACKDFEFETLVPKSIDISRTGQFTTNCQNCKMTCHFPCRQAHDQDKHRCSVMDPSGRCRICNCWWSNHFNQKYRYEMVKEKISRSSDAIRQQYQGAVNESMTNEQLLSRIEKEIEKHETQLLELMQATYPRIQRLDEIALRPHPFSTPDYIDLMIAAEKQEHRQGYQQRIVTLNKLREMAEITAKLIRDQQRGIEYSMSSLSLLFKS